MMDYCNFFLVFYICHVDTSTANRSYLCHDFVKVAPQMLLDLCIHLVVLIRFPKLSVSELRFGLERLSDTPTLTLR